MTIQFQPQQMIRVVACLLCEIRWLFYRLCTPCSNMLGFRTKVELDERILQLIRAVPWWVRGHLLVCRLLINKAEYEPLSVQKLATLRWTAEAANRIVRDRHGRVTALYWEVALVCAKVQMIEKHFDAALAAYRVILDSGSQLLSQPQFYQALEDAAACAQVAGTDQEFKRFVAQIPLRFRSPAMRSLAS